MSLLKRFQVITKALLFLTLLNFSLSGYSQINGVVVDKSTGKPVAYANIWVEYEDIGISAEEDGSFIIDHAALKGKFLVVTAVAYEKQRVEITDQLHKIELIPVIYQLSEVVINPNAKKKEIDSFKSTSVSYGFTTMIPGTIIARFYPYSSEYDMTSYLTKITFRIVSRGQSSKYRIRLFSKNEKGEPGNDLVQESFIRDTKSGEGIYEQTVTIDLQNHRVKIPYEGFFVGFEWMTKSKKDKKRFQGVGIKARTVKDTGVWNTWSYGQGVWTHSKNLTNSPPPELSFKLTLSE